MTSVDVVREWLGGVRPRTALVLGSGLGALVDRLQDVRRLSYAAVPSFPTSTVAGHAGELVVGQFAGQTVLCQNGRFHGYEGHHPGTVALPVRLFACLGISRLIVTNAAGGIHPHLTAGSLMLITDQINLTFANPLQGPLLPGAERFPDMSAAFDPGLRRLARAAALAERIPLLEGTYIGVTGPSYETPAEVRMLRTLGADAVGMSTVMEVVAARVAGLRCLGFSMIANRAAGLTRDRISHDDVLAAATRAGSALGAIIARVLQTDKA